ncbi:MAG: immunoglobulin domain-containing protein, partial [Acidobacteriia bacterium]|nr:immunoglobulin domain-containing protein [Terriglobia bacterium]
MPVTLNRNQSLTGYVTFYPSAVQAYNGTLIFTCGHGSTVQISLSGAGVQTQATPLPPTITTQPASQTVTAGQTATFTVAATGTAPLTYQWKKNGTAISGATSTSYTTPATTSSDNGAQFTVTVTN